MWVDSENPIGATPHEVMGADIDGVMSAQGMAELAEQRNLLKEERERALDAKIAAEAGLRDAAIARARLATHRWLPATRSKAALPNPATLSPTLNYLCRVIKDDTPANNGCGSL
ncbi:MAG: hypothetical protein LBK00_00560 [Treponema sp.]|nr:hypothetical protein [Treponema sp.]